MTKYMRNALRNELWTGTFVDCPHLWTATLLAALAISGAAAFGALIFRWRAASAPPPADDAAAEEHDARPRDESEALALRTASFGAWQPSALQKLTVKLIGFGRETEREVWLPGDGSALTARDLLERLSLPRSEWLVRSRSKTWKRELPADANDGVLYVVPKVLVRGGVSKRAALLQAFKKFDATRAAR